MATLINLTLFLYMNFFESALVHLGLGTPLKRFIFGAMSGHLYQMLFRPSISYTEYNQSKPFILFDSNGTFMPWWAWSLGAGSVLALFL